MTPSASRPPSTWRATPSDPSRFFSDEELARARTYQRPLRRVRWLRAGLSVAVLAVFVLRGWASSLVEWTGVTNWVVQLAVILAGLLVAFLVIDLPIDAWVDFGHDRRWGLSTQTLPTFLADQAKSFVLGLVLGLAVLVPLYALIRTTDWWWVIGWVLVTVLSVTFGFLFPVVIAPIFNRFEPLTDAELAARIAAVARSADVPIAGVLVADESRRSRRDNAYVSGLGATRRVVLYDTILEHPPELIEQVVAHELGHWRRHHLRQQLPLLALSTLLVFLALRGVEAWTGLFEWLDIDGLGDPASLPIVLATYQLVSVPAAMAMAWVSRAHEREADLDALELLGQPDEMVEMLRRIHVKNLADLDPSRMQRLRAGHPPAAERMAFARAWSALRMPEREPGSFTST